MKLCLERENFEENYVIIECDPNFEGLRENDFYFHWTNYGGNARTMKNGENPLLESLMSRYLFYGAASET